MTTNKPRTIRITELSQRAVITAANQQAVTEATERPDPTAPATPQAETRGTYVNAFGRTIAESKPTNAFGRTITETTDTDATHQTAFGRPITETREN